MADPKSEKWELRNLAHRYTVSFFNNEYGDDPAAIMARNDFPNRDLVYYNIARSNNETNAIICSAMLVTYMESQGLPYHDRRTRNGCFNSLADHLRKADGAVLTTADIVDLYFRFLGEED